MLEMNLRALFGHLVGKEVRITETPHRIGDSEAIEYSQPDPDDPVIREIREIAARRGMRLRLQWPGMMGDTSMRGSRMNLAVEKGDDGKWRVSDDMHFG